MVGLAEHGERRFMDDELTLRLAKPAERSELEALQLRASLIWEEDRARLLAALRDNPNFIEIPPEQITGGRVLVAESDGRLVGFAVVLRRDDGQGELDGLFVEPDCMRQGIGSQLVREAERVAIRDGASFLHVIANRQASKFYAANGFELIGEAQTAFGPAPAMRKVLQV